MSKQPVSKITVENSEIKREPLTDLPLKIQQFKVELEKQAKDVDKVILGNSLIEEIHPIISTSDKCANDTYGWDFNSGEKGIEERLSKEMNIFFLGTGSMPYFGEHQVTSEGGDVLCHLALQKGAYEKQPSLLMKGVGTVVLNKEFSQESGNDAYYPLDSLLNAKTKYSGNIIETMFGSGISKRVSIAMEEFYIPNLMKMIINNNVTDNDFVSYDINIVGHSRGAITGFHMITCIEEWLNNVKDKENNIHFNTIAKLCHMPKSQVIKAMRLIQNGNVDCRINSLSFDPVEGKCRSSESIEWFSNDTTIPIAIQGLDKPLSTNCSSMPSRVKKAEIYLAESERRKDFRPTLPEFCPHTNVSYKLQMGTHSTMTGNIGDDDGTGQDAYQSVKKYRFVKEAALASIDKVKLDATQFLFTEKLPPFQRHIFRRIFRSDISEQRYAYQTTANYFNKILSENFKTNLKFKIFISSHIKNKDEDILNKNTFLNLLEQNADFRVSCAEWLMQQDAKIASHAYFLLNKDIHDRYLHATGPQKRRVLKIWQEEMKRDTTSVILGPITGHKYYSLGMQDPEQSREVYLRKEMDKIAKHSLFDKFKEFHTRNKEYKNPYHVVLSELLHIDNLQSNEAILDLDLSFAKINEMLIKRKQHAHFHVCQLEDELSIPIQIFIGNLERCHFSRDLQVAALGMLMHQIEQFHESNFNILSEIILKHLSCSRKRMLFNESKATFLNAKMVKDAKIELSDIKNKMTMYLKECQSEHAQTRLAVLLNKLDDFQDHVNSHNIPSKIRELKSEIKEIQKLEIEMDSFKNRIYNFVFGIKVIDPNQFFGEVIHHLKSISQGTNALSEQIDQLKINPDKLNSLPCLWGLNLYRNNLITMQEAANDGYKSSRKMLINMS